jgi:hypothetical protein
MMVGEVIILINENLQYDRIMNECESKVKASENRDVPTSWPPEIESKQKVKRLECIANIGTRTLISG